MSFSSSSLYILASIKKITYWIFDLQLFSFIHELIFFTLLMHKFLKFWWSLTYFFCLCFWCHSRDAVLTAIAWRNHTWQKLCSFHNLIWEKDRSQETTLQRSWAQKSDSPKFWLSGFGQITLETQFPNLENVGNFPYLRLWGWNRIGL